MKKAVVSIDLEDWYHLDYVDIKKSNYTMLDGFENILSETEGRKIPISVFCVTEILDSLKNFFKGIDHSYLDNIDIGLHGIDHTRPLLLEPKEFRKTVSDGKKILEDFFGKEVLGYRAPCFSLDRERLDILIEEGYSYDSSYIKFKDHPLYGEIDLRGFVSVQDNIYQKDNFYEFEISTLNIAKKNIPISGGGYLRIFPWYIFSRMLNKYLSFNDNYTIFLHPFEFSNLKTPAVKELTFMNKFRFKYNQQNGLTKLVKLLNLLSKNNIKFTNYKELMFFHNN